MRTPMILLALAMVGCATPERQAARPAISPTPIAAGPAFGTIPAEELRRAAARVLFWSQAERDANFPHMERLFPGHVVKAAQRPVPLPAGAPLPIPAAEIDAFVRDTNIAGLIVLDHGRVRLERYARGLTPDGRWTSFSVAKSITSTLVGAAVRDGYIESVGDPITRYIPELAGSAYEGVTIEQVLTMTSGVRWNEDYTDPKSDVVALFERPVPPGADPTVAYLRTLPRAAAPGTKWTYKTGETNLIGVLVARATRLPLANYAAARIAGPAGFGQDGIWSVDPSRQEVGGCCLALSLRDYARFGQYVLAGGRGQVPDGWFDRALAAQQPLGGGRGYGYQWWTYPDGASAEGIYGQSVFVDRKHAIVVVMLSAWPNAIDRALGERADGFTRRIVQAAVAPATDANR